MAILAVNPAGNTPQGNGHAQGDPGDLFDFVPAEPGPRDDEGVVLLFASLPAVQGQRPAADIVDGFLGNDAASTWNSDWLF